MKSLLLKDFLLIKNQRRSVPMFIALGIIFSVINYADFGIAYLGMMAAFIAAGTISYDEFDHGYSFLFTLPFSRKTYVNEKFVFSALLTVMGLILGTACAYIIMLIKPESANGLEIWVAVTGTFALSVVLASIMIPLRIRFGSERSRTATFIVFAIIAILMIAAGEFFTDEFFAFTVTISDADMAIIAAAIVLIAFITGYSLSKKWLNKKEF